MEDSGDFLELRMMGGVVMDDSGDLLVLMVMGGLVTMAQLSGDPPILSMLSPSTRSASVNSWIACAHAQCCLQQGCKGTDIPKPEIFYLPD